MKNITKKLILVLLAFSGFNIIQAVEPSWKKIDFDSLKGGTREDIEILQSINEFGNRLIILNNELENIRNLALEKGLYQELEQNIENAQDKLSSYSKIRKSPGYQFEFIKYLQPLSELTLMIQNLKEIVVPKKEKEQKREAEAKPEMPKREAETAEEAGIPEKLKDRIDTLKSKFENIKKSYELRRVRERKIDVMNKQLEDLLKNLRQGIIDEQAISTLEFSVNNEYNLISRRLSSRLDLMIKKIDTFENRLKNLNIEVDIETKEILREIYKRITELQEYVKQGVGLSYYVEIIKLDANISRLFNITLQEGFKELKERYRDIFGQEEEEEKISEEEAGTSIDIGSEEFNALKTKLIKNYSILISEEFDAIIADLNKENLDSRNKQNKTIENKLIESGKRKEVSNLKKRLARMSLIEKLSLYRPTDNLIKQILEDQKKIKSVPDIKQFIDQQEKTLKEKLGENALNYLDSYAWFALMRKELFGKK